MQMNILGEEVKRNKIKKKFLKIVTSSHISRDLDRNVKPHKVILCFHEH